MAYVPPAHRDAVVLNMTAMRGPSRARWFDPTSGAYTTIGDRLPNDASRSFMTPGSNSAGEQDWVLVLEAPAEPTDTHDQDQEQRR